MVGEGEEVGGVGGRGRRIWSDLGVSVCDLAMEPCLGSRADWYLEIVLGLAAAAEKEEEEDEDELELGAEPVLLLPLLLLLLDFPTSGDDEYDAMGVEEVRLGSLRTVSLEETESSSLGEVGAVKQIISGPNE